MAALVTSLQESDFMDDASCALILQMQSEDIDELFTSRKGKSREEVLSYSDLALDIFQEYFEV